MTDINLRTLPLHMRLQVFRSQDAELAALDADEIAPGSVLLTYWEAYPFGRAHSPGWQVSFYSRPPGARRMLLRSRRAPGSKPRRHVRHDAAAHRAEPMSTGGVAVGKP